MSIASPSPAEDSTLQPSVTELASLPPNSRGGQATVKARNSNETAMSAASSRRSLHSTEDDIFGPTSPGVVRMQAIANEITTTDRWFIFVSIFLLGYVYGLDGLLRYVYQPYATAGFSTHSTLATVNVLRSVVAAAAYPTAAKIADVFGRLECVIVSVLFYVIGTIVEATCTNVEGFAAGAVIYQIGYTALLLLVEVIIADITTLNTRLIFSFVPPLSFLINTWISGNISSAVLSITTWQWGIGMWGIILTAASLPLLVSLYLPYRRAVRKHRLDNHPTLFALLKRHRFFVALFGQLDVIGILFIVVTFSLILVPFTIAGSSEDQWRTAKVIAPLVLGFVCMLIWIGWEWYYANYTLQSDWMRLRRPFVPFHLFRDRAVWGALGIGFMLNFCWYMQGNFLYTVMIVAFDQSILSATRYASLYSFCSVLMGITTGLVVVKFCPYLKPFIVFGTCFFLVAFGLLIEFRGGGVIGGVIAAQVLLGFGGGLFTYPAQTSIQASTRHDHVAIVTGLYLAMTNIGAAFGSAISGLIWSRTLIPELLRNLPPPYNNSTVAEDIFGSPFVWATQYPMGTPVRDGIIESYMATQKLLCITGACLCAPLILFSLCIRNPRLTAEQSLTRNRNEGATEERELSIWARLWM